MPSPLRMTAGVVVLMTLVGGASASSILDPAALEAPGCPPVDGSLCDGDYSHLIPGDADGDGWVTDCDYTIWADNYGLTNATWTQGDFNGDGIVSDGDYTVWADNYGQGFVSQPVPEPLTAVAALCGAAAVTGYLRRRRRA